jgi:ADP-heptose:LPS heptosyltransferase
MNRGGHPKILIIRFSSIGDIVLTTPVIRCLKKQVPNVEVHYLTKKQFAPVLAANPYIDRLHFLDSNLAKTVEALRDENYYRVIDLHNNQRTLVLKTLLGNSSASFPKLNFEKWLMVYFKINKLPDVHIVDRYMETVAPLGVVNDGDGLDHFIPVVDEVNIKELPEQFHNGYIAWVIGAQHTTKRYPAAKIVKVCKKSTLPIILLGGKEDTENGHRIAAGVGGTRILNACGKYSLNGSASLVRQARKVVTNDTGLMHIAAAFNKPIISLWGNTIPEFGMFPYYGNDDVPESRIIEVEGLDCRPCSKLGYAKCPRGHFLCMEAIEEDLILQQINK